jgi:hypothetical protein
VFGPGIYFQTDQVIFVPEWPKGEFVSILASFWTKSFVCKDAVNRDSIIQSMKDQRFLFPVSLPDDRAIPSGRTSKHCSIRPDDMPYRPKC